MMAITKKEDVKKKISYYYTKLKNIKISITGKDIMKLGVKAGPRYKEILKKILNAKLNGFVNTVEEELKMLKNIVF